jgi:hypothetical protein
LIFMIFWLNLSTVVINLFHGHCYKTFFIRHLWFSKIKSRVFVPYEHFLINNTNSWCAPLWWVLKLTDYKY